MVPPRLGGRRLYEQVFDAVKWVWRRPGGTVASMPPAPDTSRTPWRFVFGGVLVLAMVSSTQIPAGIGIVASFVRDDLGISRTQIGALITTTIIVGAVLSPITGRVTDVLGGRRSILVLFAAAGIAYGMLAASPAYWLMFIPATIAGVAQAGGNPITNKLIALHAPVGRRGVVTGIKQSGVQLGAFASGIVMPFVAAGWGWRWAFGVILVVPLLGIVGSLGSLPEDRADPQRRSSIDTGGPLPRAIVYLSVYGGLLGLGAAYTFLVPLFAEESLGLSEQAGGLAAGIIGFVSLFARIAWARHADHTASHDRALLIIAAGSVAAVGLFVAAQEVAAWIIWPAAVATGLTSSSWNSVGMLAVIDHAGSERSGRASGIVMFGFLTGLAIGPTLFGWLVDVTGSYTSMWLTSLVVLGTATVLAAWWGRSPANPDRG
jgi:predicted MFS family arabinose efflux permease